MMMDTKNGILKILDNIFLYLEKNKIVVRFKYEFFEVAKIFVEKLKLHYKETESKELSTEDIKELIKPYLLEILEIYNDFFKTKTQVTEIDHTFLDMRYFDYTQVYYKTNEMIKSFNVTGDKSSLDTKLISSFTTVQLSIALLATYIMLNEGEDYKYKVILTEEAIREIDSKHQEVLDNSGSLKKDLDKLLSLPSKGSNKKKLLN
jgi:hypothetical protein